MISLIHLQAYGLTEHSCITLTHGDPAKGNGIAKKNSVGFILPNLEVKFIDPESGRSLCQNSHGELCVRSQCVMLGNYYFLLDKFFSQYFFFFEGLFFV